MKREINKNAAEAKELKWLEEAVRLMDSKFTLPGTKFKFGIDPLLGLIPGAGDAITFGISGALVIAMAKYGASRKVIILMVLNVLLDAVIGTIPLVGWLFDFGFKANQRNIRLLKRHYEEGKNKGTGTGILIAIAVVLLLMFAGLIFLVWKLFEWLFGLF